MNSQLPAFHRFGQDHALGLLFVCAMAWLVQRLGRRYPRAIEAILASWLALYVFGAYRLRWGELTWTTALPLHLCDLLLILAFGLLAKPPQSTGGLAPLSFDLLFFGAWGGSVWAFITPDLHVGFPNWRYFEFFFGHGLIFWLLAHFYWNRRCLMARGAALRAWRWLCYYTVVVGAMDLAFGWNYGYFRSKPVGGSDIDYFGPWPIYVLVALAIEGVLFVALERAVLWAQKIKESKH